MAQINRRVTVEVPTSKPDGKVLKLTWAGDEVEIVTPLSWGDPRVGLEDLEAAVRELRESVGESG